MPKPPTYSELDIIACQATRAAVSDEDSSEQDCPYGDDDPERREHWLSIYRVWADETFTEDGK